jgi:glycerol dehydrogenase
MIKTIGFPGRYIQGPQAISHLPELLQEFQVKNPVILMDDIVREAAGDAIVSPLHEVGIVPKILRFEGECSAQAISMLAVDIDPTRDDVIIGFGGGKTIDTAKGLSKAHNLRLIIIPTIASNDSPTSRLIVLYDKQHRVAGVDILTRNPDVVLVDSSIIARAPTRFFSAGLGDALSKKFEAQQCYLAGGKNFFGTQSLATARLLADRCYETILEFGLPALLHLKQHGTSDENVERAIEATVLLSGLGFESGGLSISHALTRGFTAHPGMSKFLHGELVAFGSIVQLFAENRSMDEIYTHARFCQSIDLPVTLTQLGAPNATQEEIMEMATLTIAAPYIGNIDPPADANRIAVCIKSADELGKKLRG